MYPSDNFRRFVRFLIFHSNRNTVNLAISECWLYECVLFYNQKTNVFVFLLIQSSRVSHILSLYQIAMIDSRKKSIEIICTGILVSDRKRPNANIAIQFLFNDKFEISISNCEFNYVRIWGYKRHIQMW